MSILNSRSEIIKLDRRTEGGLPCVIYIWVTEGEFQCSIFGPLLVLVLEKTW